MAGAPLMHLDGHEEWPEGPRSRSAVKFIVEDDKSKLQAQGSSPLGQLVLAHCPVDRLHESNEPRHAVRQLLGTLNESSNVKRETAACPGTEEPTLH